MAIIVSADVTGRLSTQAYTRLFAKDGGNTVDATYFALMVAEAESLIRVWSQAAFPGGFDAAGGTVDEAIKGYAVDVLLYLAAKRHPSAGQEGAYRVGFDDAQKFFKQLNRDQDARPVRNSQGRAVPRAEARNLTDAGGLPTDPFTRVADGKDGSGF